MKHEQYFNEFLSKHVNLNQNRVSDLESRVVTITNFLKEKLGGYRKYSSQGSYAHKTIIKPVQDNDEFDADVLVFIKDDHFNPNNFVTDYIDDVYNTIKDNGTYSNMVKRKTRCVTIDYSGDFHLDIVPCIEYDDIHYICNRKDKKYEKTDGDGYKSWLVGKNQTVGSNNFRKTTRLLKFLRDHKDNFSVKSILLTTMLGNQVTYGDIPNNFSDLPTTLKTLSNQLNRFLQGCPNVPIIKNPVMPGEDFNRHWDQKKYQNFRDKFNSYNTKINEAFDSKNHNESVKKWRVLFGNKFGESSSNKSTASVAGVSAGITIPAVAATKPYAHSNE